MITFAPVMGTIGEERNIRKTSRIITEVRPAANNAMRGAVILNEATLTFIGEASFDKKQKMVNDKKTGQGNVSLPADVLPAA
ncbi:MAG: hypothetical protein H7252_01370 [Cytophaga sp.]|nr:hypothetical protein [Undibacterium sp.]